MAIPIQYKSIVVQSTILMQTQYQPVQCKSILIQRKYIPVQRKPLLAQSKSVPVQCKSILVQGTILVYCQSVQVRIELYWKIESSGTILSQSILARSESLLVRCQVGLDRHNVHTGTKYIYTGTKRNSVLVQNECLYKYNFLP